MSNYYYDLHIHSALSPCADDTMTPNNIAGFAALNGLSIAALTDHNTSRNCPAFFKACKRYGVVPVAGMELTTAEEIHLVCLFEFLERALAFDDAVLQTRIKIKNKTEIFGNQLLFDEEDNIVGTEEFFLPNATRLSLDDAVKLVTSFGGLAYPAHIDREANGIVSILGDFPPEPFFGAYELYRAEKRGEYEQKYPLLEKKLFISSSDAHTLDAIKEKENFFLLEDEPYSSELIRKRLFEKLSEELEK